MNNIVSLTVTKDLESPLQDRTYHVKVNSKLIRSFNELSDDYALHNATQLAIQECENFKKQGLKAMMVTDLASNRGC